MLNCYKMTKEEQELYHSNVKAKSDWNAGIRFAEKKAAEKAKVEGLEEGRKSIAKNLKQKGMIVDEISQITGLSLQEIELL